MYSRDELQKIGDLCVKNEIIILSDEVYDRLYYVPFTRMATLSPEIEKLTITVGSAGKNFYATGWRVGTFRSTLPFSPVSLFNSIFFRLSSLTFVLLSPLTGWLMGPANLIKYVSAAHTRICYSSVSPLQEACAVGFEQAESEGFWDKTITDMKSKMDRFNEIWAELDLPYSEPEGGYFVLVNMKKVQVPADYPFPEHVASRPRDFKLAWFLIQEVGVAAIPPTEFYTQANAHLAEDYVRFAVCKDDEVLEEAKRRLRGLKKYMQ